MPVIEFIVYLLELKLINKLAENGIWQHITDKLNRDKYYDKLALASMAVSDTTAHRDDGARAGYGAMGN